MGKGSKMRTKNYKAVTNNWDNIFGEKDLAEYHKHSEIKEKQAKEASAEEIRFNLYK